MSTSIEVVIRVESVGLPAAPLWRVEVESVAPRAVVHITPLRDEEVRTLPDVPDGVETWTDLASSFSPNSVWTPQLKTMKAAGALLRERLLGDAKIIRHFGTVEARAKEQGRPLRVLFEVEPEADGPTSVLSVLPLELGYNRQNFLFKEPGYGALRCDPRAEARTLTLPRRGRALVATAHADGREPSAAALEAHREAIVAAVERIGWEVIQLPDATPALLEQALLGSNGFDLVYVACHGLGDPSVGGRLVLRGGTTSGETLGQWLEEAARAGTPVGAVLLCACSSAAPARGENTSGMAQWLALEGRANTSLGFRGPVRVEWALGFLERMFDQIGAGESLERAFVKTRAKVPHEDPQWTLPVLYVRRQDTATLGPRVLGVEPALAFRGSERSLESAVETLSQLAWEGEANPEDEEEAAQLVRRIGNDPARLRLAAGTIAHDGMSAKDYLASLTSAGVTADTPDEMRLPRLVEQALAGLPEDHRRAFFRLAALAPGRGSSRELARQLAEPEPWTSSTLWRLARRGLLVADQGVYSIDASVCIAARHLALRS